MLSVFSEQRPTWRITDIAAEVSLPLPTAYRIVMTLTAEGYLDHLPSGEYRPGVRVLTLGTAALRSLDLVELATPQAPGTGQRDPGDGEPRRADRRPGALPGPAAQLRPGHGQYPGRLAAARRAHLDRQAAARLSRTTPSWTSASPRSHSTGTAGPNAKRSLDELRPELAAIRAQGWATQDEELAYGLRSVAAPVRGENGAVVAGANLAVQSRDWPAARITRELRPMVLATPARRSRNCSATAGE